MDWIQVTNVAVKNENPGKLTDDFALEISFVCLKDLEVAMNWRLVYVGCADDKSKDQELEVVELGPLKRGVMKFTFEADPPDFSVIDNDDVWGSTVILLEASYRNQEFVRIGYYVHNYYPDPTMQDDPPDVPELAQMCRFIVADEPRVTRFNINWSGSDETSELTGIPVAMTGIGMPGASAGNPNSLQQGQQNETSETQNEFGAISSSNPLPENVAQHNNLPPAEQAKPWMGQSNGTACSSIFGHPAGAASSLGYNQQLTHTHGFVNGIEDCGME